MVTVLVDKDTCAICWTAATHRISRQMYLVEGKDNSSPIVKGFLALAIRLATEYDALSAFPLLMWLPSEISFVLRIPVFHLQNTQLACLLFHGVWCFSGEAVFGVSLLHYGACRRILCRAPLVCGNYLSR